MNTAADAQESFVQQRMLYEPADRPTRLDVHRLGDHLIGIFREQFDRIVTLAGFRLKPANADFTIWSFVDPDTGLEGRLLNVAGWLQDDHVALSTPGTAYLVRDAGRLLGLYLPPTPKRLKLTEANYKTVQAKPGHPLYPDTWPKGLVVRVIRSWLYRVVIVDEKYLLARLTVD
jgi:hypothetical protein